MHRGFIDEPFQDGYIYNIETGETFTITIKEVTDKKAICVWPCKTWCYAEDKHEYSYKSDDYAVYNVPVELTDDEIETLIDKGTIGGTEI